MRYVLSIGVAIGCLVAGAQSAQPLQTQPPTAAQQRPVFRGGTYTTGFIAERPELWHEDIGE